MLPKYTRKPELSARLLLAVWQRAKTGKSFSTTALADELGIQNAQNRGWISTRIWEWKKRGLLTELPRVGIAKLYHVSQEGLSFFEPPAPAPPPPPPTPAPVERPERRNPRTMDELMHDWVAGQLQPFTAMFKGVLTEMQRLRSDVDSIMDVLSRPEGERPPLPEPAPREPLPAVPANGAALITPPPLLTLTPVAPPAKQQRPTVLEVLASSFPFWVVSRDAVAEFEECDVTTQNRVLRILRAAYLQPDRWPRLGKPYGSISVPAVFRTRPGSWWSFRVGKKDRLVVRRDGKHVTVEFIIKRNDHRWYSSEK